MMTLHLRVVALALAVVAALGVRAGAITVDCAYPGGNVRVRSIEKTPGVVEVAPDLRDTEGYWFHFDFTVRGAEGRTVLFRFPQNGSPYLSSLGPAVCRDGRTWSWLRPDGTRHEPANAFSFAFGKEDRAVRFALSIPYLQRDWDAFTAPWRGTDDVRFETLCKSQSGKRDVELLRVPCRKAAQWLFVFTARHHACETTGNPPMEGILKELMSGSPESRWAREHAECVFVPFMDKDGVEEGDQGKNRRPWDYNRDYAKGRYAAVRAIKELIVRESAGRQIVFVDLHSPFVRSLPHCAEQDQAFTFGADDARLNAHWESFRANWKAAQAGGALRYDGRYDIRARQGYWNEMKKAWDKGLLGSDPWVRTLPNAYLATCCEFGYSLCGGVNTFDGMRELGGNLFKALVRTARPAFDIRAEGASPANAPGVNARAIQRTIDAAAVVGGRVVVPKGEWVSGTFWLKSGVELHLEKDAVLKASPNLADYNAEDAYPENFGCPKSEYWRGLHFIICRAAENISITGKGTVHGNGDVFFDEKPIRYFEWMTPDAHCWWNGIRWAKDKVNLRPGQLIVFVKCRNVRVEGVTIRNSPCWSLYFHGCEEVTVRDYTVRNGADDGNADGVDVDCFKNVLLEDMDIRTGDDAVAIRGSGRRLGLDPQPACENVVVRRARLDSTSSVFRIGVGDGVIRNVTVEDVESLIGGTAINIAGCYGDPEKSGVDMENIVFRRCRFADCRRAYLIMTGGRRQTFGIRNVTLEDVSFPADSSRQIGAWGGNPEPIDIVINGKRLR